MVFSGRCIDIKYCDTIVHVRLTGCTGLHQSSRDGQEQASSSNAQPVDNQHAKRCRTDADQTEGGSKKKQGLAREGGSVSIDAGDDIVRGFDAVAFCLAGSSQFFKSALEGGQRLEQSCGGTKNVVTLQLPTADLEAFEYLMNFVHNEVGPMDHSIGELLTNSWLTISWPSVQRNWFGITTSISRMLSRY